MASLEVNDSAKDTLEEKRKRCLLGDLPDDFLRIPVYNPTAAYNYPIVQQQYVKTIQLEITVVQARLVKNYGITRMDPYCKVRIGHKTFETYTAFNGSKNPYWNKKFMSPIPKGVEAIHIAIFDEKTMSADEEIAFTTIELPKEIQDGRIVDKWYSLSGKQGDNQEGQINVVLSMKEVPVMQNSMYGNVPVPNLMPAYHHSPAPNRQQQIPVTPVQRPEPVEILDEDINQIHEMFPNIDKDVIRSILEEQNGNKDTCISALLTMADDDATTAAATQANAE